MIGELVKAYSEQLSLNARIKKTRFLKIFRILIWLPVSLILVATLLVGDGNRYLFFACLYLCLFLMFLIACLREVFIFDQLNKEFSLGSESPVIFSYRKHMGQIKSQILSDLRGYMVNDRLKLEDLLPAELARLSQAIRSRAKKYDGKVPFPGSVLGGLFLGVFGIWLGAVVEINVASEEFDAMATGLPLLTLLIAASIVMLFFIGKSILFFVEVVLNRKYYETMRLADMVEDMSFERH